MTTNVSTQPVASTLQLCSHSTVVNDPDCIRYR
jgi:hypothetical protein